MATTENFLDATKIEPRFKHSTIFNTFDGLKEGETFTLQNDHDPKPLYYQLSHDHGDLLVWEYLEEGPVWWKVKIGKKGKESAIQNDGNEDVIDVTKLEARVRHSTIFGKYHDMASGDSFIVLADHDPQHLYDHLKENFGDNVIFEKLENGPKQWKVRLGKKDANLTPSATSDVNVIDVTKIEPRQKHATILGTFAGLKEGESFVIKNDHDPKPLYFQLKNEYGDAVTWDYVEEGPVWWKVQLGKKGNKAGAEREGEVILNVTLLEPKKKHPTIFEHFDNLQEGESFVIHNDHDPKPLYYQLVAERGEIFNWEYLEEGPVWWKIRIEKKVLGEGKETIGSIVAKDLRTAEVFKKYDLDFCCDGKKTIKEACAIKGIDIRSVEKDLQMIESTSTARALPFNEWNEDFLADYIVNTHHAFARKNVPEIRKYAAKVKQVHGANHPELFRLHEIVEQLSNELLEHMVKEEETLFPFIKQLVNAKNNNLPYPETNYDSVDDPIQLMTDEHQSVGDMIHEIEHLTDNYTAPSDACASYNLLFKMLHELDEDTHIHIHLENNILFPKTKEIEKSLRS